MARMRWLGPGLFGGGVIVAIAAILYWLHARPVAGEEIDRMPCSGATLVVRAEQGGDRNFIELRNGDDVKWQALIPHYAGAKGRPGIACGKRTMTVRIERGGRAEVWGIDLETGEKAGGYRLAEEHQPIHIEPTGPITLTDGSKAYEIVGGAGWHQLVAVDLLSGEGVWKADLGPEPIASGGVDPVGGVYVRQAGRERDFDPNTGLERKPTR